MALLLYGNRLRNYFFDTVRLDTCSVTTDGQPACVASAYIYYVPPTMTPISDTVPVNQACGQSPPPDTAVGASSTVGVGLTSGPAQ